MARWDDYTTGERIKLLRGREIRQADLDHVTKPYWLSEHPHRSSWLCCPATVRLLPVTAQPVFTRGWRRLAYVNGPSTHA